MDIQFLQHVYYTLGSLAIMLGALWRFHTYHVKARDVMKDDIQKQVDTLETRLNGVDVKQAEQSAQMGGVKELLAEVRSDIKTLLAKAA